MALRTSSATPLAASQSKSEIAFIDRGVDDIETLLAGMRPEVEPILLSDDEPAPRQMARAVRGREGLEAIHVIAHGRPGEVLFSAGALSIGSVGTCKSEIAEIGHALRNGMVHLWTCRTVESESGRAFGVALAGMINAPVAASTQLVGSPTRGGNWCLDAYFGGDDARVPLTAEGVSTYAGVMASSHPPQGTDSTITSNEDGTYALKVADFGFSDPNDSPPDTFVAVEITTLPTHGTLTLNGVAVTAGQLISVANITSGLLVFTPAANANGTNYASFTFQVEDSGNANGANQSNLDHSPNTLTFNITAVNDAPIASGIATLASINEDTAAPSGATVTSLFSGNFSDAADQVSGGSSANTFAGIAISNYTADASKGSWQYSTNGGTSWTTLSSATTSSAITLNGSDLLRFVPAANYNGSATALSANLIESGQSITSGATTNLTGVTGGTTHISSGTVALSEAINPVDDAPVNTVPATTQTDHWEVTGNVVFSSVNGNQISVSDVDNASLTVTLSVSHGTLTLNGTDGLTFSDGSNGESSMTFMGTTTDINAALNGLTYHTTGTDTQAGDVNDTLTLHTSDGTLSADSLVNFDVVCFMPGTMVATPQGQVAVENLKTGDLVLTVDGQAKPISWLGRQTVSTIFADKLRVLPIRIKAGGLAENIPARDLLISPDHAVLINGALVQAGALVNGTSIIREPRVPAVFTYYHVEVDDHSLILAENTPAETFVDNVDRLRFDNWAEHEALYPDGKSITELPYPRAKAHRQVPVNIRVMLAERAERIGAVADRSAVA